MIALIAFVFGSSAPLARFANNRAVTIHHFKVFEFIAFCLSFDGPRQLLRDAVFVADQSAGLLMFSKETK